MTLPEKAAAERVGQQDNAQHACNHRAPPKDADAFAKQKGGQDRHKNDRRLQKCCCLTKWQQADGGEPARHGRATKDDAKWQGSILR